MATPPGRDRRGAEQSRRSRCSARTIISSGRSARSAKSAGAAPTDLLKRELAVLIFADVGPDSPAEEAAVVKWIEAGGLLLRFAGPHLAEQGDQLLPVRLRHGGGRTIGGALSWEQPAKLAPFAPESPFAGLTVPADVTVSRQVLAEPDLDLAGKTWARLADGTPLVTAEKRGQGWIVLVHTTANADWSNLALSGLFVEMLRRIDAMSQGVTEAGDQALPPIETLDGFGRLQRAPPTARPIPAKEMATAIASPQHPPGFYGTADAKRALNLSAGISANSNRSTACRRKPTRESFPSRPRDRSASAAADRGACFWRSPIC